MAEIINIQNINPNTFETQTYSPEDNALISSTSADSTFSSSIDIVEYFIYDLNGNILSENVNGYPSYYINNNIISLTPEENLKNAGFTEGNYNTLYNFLRPKLGSNSLNRYFISEISSDRTEIRLDTTVIPNSVVVSSTNELLNEISTTVGSYYDFYLDFGNNQLIIANNVLLDESNENNPTVLIKLYEALPQQFSLKNELWAVTKVLEPVAYNISIINTFDILDNNIYLKGPNTNLNIKDQINNSTDYVNSANLNATNTSQGSGSFQYQLNSLLAETGIEINIDYSDYSNFIHFSSAQTRLENFYYKLSLIEQYNYSASLSSGTPTNYYVSSSNVIYQNKIDDVITNFDEYEYFLYYESGSTCWPKIGNTPPYTNVNTTSVLGQAWFVSQSLVAENYDLENNNALTLAIPSYISEDPDNFQFELFVEMIGQSFDSVFVYLQDVTNKYNADNRLNYGVSKELVADVLRDMGIKIYQNNFSSDDLYSALIGFTPSGSLYNLPYTTTQYPVPSGSFLEYINTYVTASATGSLIPTEDINFETYKRIYANLPLLLKKKGSTQGLRNLITTYGIPDTILRVNEFGGKDKNSNTWDYWQNEYDYTFSTSGSGFINTQWNGNDMFPAWDLEPYTTLAVQRHGLASKTTNSPVTLLNTIVSSSTGISGGGLSSGAVLAPNGKLYMSPQDAEKVIEFDPITNIMQFVGPSFGFSTAKYFGGCLAPNGQIYFAGGRFKNYVQFDPDTYTTNIVNVPSASGANSYWAGIVTAPNGFVYMIPRNTQLIVKINPVDNTFTTFGNIIGSAKYRGAVLGADGKIYCVPRSATQIMVIDPADDSISFFGNFSFLGSEKWEGGSLAPNGKIYCMPSGGIATVGGLYPILVIDTNNQTTYIIYSERTIAQCTTGPDGNIYGSSLSNTPGYYFQLNTTTDTFTWTLQSGLLFAVSHIGAAVGLDGAIYLVPYNSSLFYRISEPQVINPNRALSRFYNKGL
jgi:hypothetical protein